MDIRQLNETACYQAILARDRRFDGLMFVGVASTGIYCRPICPAKTPLQRNCGYYPSAAAAERAGFRPCLRCRPELAPGNARVDAVGRLASAAASSIEDGALTDSSVETLAERLGVTSRHLRRAVEREFGVSPIALAQTQRLLTAKRLLTDTRLPITEVAFASGFSSLRRFNALFLERYRMNPTDLRRTAASANRPQTIVCEIAFRPPLDWYSHLDFLTKRATAGVEMAADGKYYRTVAAGRASGWVSVGLSHRPATLRVEMSESLAPALIKVVAGVKRVCDVSANPSQIADRLGDIAAARPGLRVPGVFDGFELAVRAVLGQQVSVAAATTLSGRFTTAFGELVETPYPELTRATPTAQRIAEVDPAEIAALGIVGARARTIVELAKAVVDGKVDLSAHADPARTAESLKKIPGIGEWTAQYVGMRALGWPDAFPHTDLGIMKALGTRDSKHVLAEAEKWRPWRAYAVMHLWKSLEELN
jgi:AraC family transcriptional regulator of adaptative response / DNA-3-methyladenine glycosylase II